MRYRPAARVPPQGTRKNHGNTVHERAVPKVDFEMEAAVNLIIVQRNDGQSKHDADSSRFFMGLEMACRLRTENRIDGNSKG